MWTDLRQGTSRSLGARPIQSPGVWLIDGYADNGPMDTDKTKLNALAKLHTDDSIVQNKLEGCRRRAVSDQITTYVDKTGKTSTLGVMTCQLLHLCSDCAERDAGPVAARLARRIEAWQHLGHTVLMLTLTVPHDRGDRLDDVATWIAAGHRAVLVGSARTRLKRFGLRHVFRRSETDWSGKGGWHPHEHLILYCRGTLTTEQIEDLRQDLSGRFLRAITRAGATRLEKAGDHAVHLREVAPGDGTKVAAYLTKTTVWGGEVTGAHQILAMLGEHDVSQGEDRCACGRCRWLRDMWSEYVSWTRASKRRRYAEPSKIDADLADQGVETPTEAPKPKRRATSLIDRLGWEYAVLLDCQEEVVQAAAVGGHEDARLVLSGRLIAAGMPVTEAIGNAMVWIQPPPIEVAEPTSGGDGPSNPEGPQATSWWRRYLRRLSLRRYPTR